ncbi:MAG: glycosyltransferase family 4 protein [Pyrinomonadaceae bacterium]
MRILITNNSLSVRAGTQLYVRDLAIGLLRRGHTPICYSPGLGEVAQEIRAATVPVIDDLEAMAMPPDVIHGQHHLTAMTALLHFPGVPAIYFCHGWLPWEELPPRFPRILRYVAVDQTCRDRLTWEQGIPDDRVRVLLNFVDLERFKSRGPLPPHPRRALMLSNNACDQNSLRPVREACDRAGIALDVLGLAVNQVCVAPEVVIGNYDLVFAKGRSALEALAVGTAIILCDVTGSGPMVTTENLGRLRSLNFGIRALQEPVNCSVLSREIARYDPSDAKKVSQEIRATAGHEAVLDELLCLYREVIQEHANSTDNMTAEHRAASAYLRAMSAGLAAKESELDRMAGSRGMRMLHRLATMRHNVLSDVSTQAARLFKRRATDNRNGRKASL